MITGTATSPSTVLTDALVVREDRYWVAIGRVLGTRRKPWHSITVPLVCGLLAGLDTLVITAAGIAALFAYADLGYVAKVFLPYLAISLAGAGGTVLLANTTWLYREDVLETPFLKPWQAMGCWFATLLGLLGAVFFLHADRFVSRGWVGLWFAFGIAGLGLARITLRAKVAWWRSCGWMRRRLVIVGSARTIVELQSRLAEPGLRDFYDLIGICSEDEPASPLAPTIAQVQSTGALVALVRDRAVETVMIGFGSQTVAALNAISRALAELPVEVVLCPEGELLEMPVIQAHQVGSLSLLQVSRPPLDEWARIVKGLEDRIFSAALLVLFAPVMVAAALAIRLESSGPVLFRQHRFGFNHQPISVLKFRSMHADLGDPTGAARTVRGDRRVTTVGRFLRRTSIDELPQLFNVLRGEMSLVGPRAHPIMMTVAGQLYDEAVAGYAARHRVKPGITGLAQINGCRGEIDSMEKAQARIRYDLDYVSRWSLWLDLKIILLTPFRALRRVY